MFPKIRGTPKWMVYNETPIKMDDLGVPLFLETSTFCNGKIQLLTFSEFFFPARIGECHTLYFKKQSNNFLRVFFGGFYFSFAFFLSGVQFAVFVVTTIYIK